MKTSSYVFTCAIGALFAPTLTAAPIPDANKNASPQISIQAQSIDQILDKVKKSLRVFLPAKEYPSIEKELLGALDMKNLPGLDPKRPFGFYATLDASLTLGNIEKSVAVLMVPVTSEKEFLALLEKGKIPVEKKEGFYSISLPNSPLELALRFHKDYAYVGFAGKNLDMKLLLDPKEVISSKETAALVMKVRIDQIPEELKDEGIKMLEQTFDQVKGIPLGEKQSELFQKYLKLVLGWYKMGLNDGREWVQRIDLDSSTGELRVEMTLDGKPSSKLAKSIAGLPPTKNDFLGIVGKDSVGHVLLEMPLFNEELRDLFHSITEVMHESFTRTAGKMPEEAIAAGTELIKTLGRTLKSGDMNLAASLRGPNKEGFYTGIAAVRLKDTAALEKSLRAAVKLAPEKFQKALKLDAEKIDGLAVHEIDFSDDMPAEMKKGFGKNAKLYVLFAPDALLAAFGPEGMTFLKEAVASKGGPAPLIQIEMNARRLGQFIKTVAEPKGGEDYFAQLAKFERFSLLTVEMSGGEKLTIKKSFGAVPALLWLMPRASSTKIQAAPMAVPLPPAKQ